jgi:putative transposase
MLKSNKYRIYPTEQQKELLTNIFGQVRFVYNLGLETKITAYAVNKKNTDCFDLNKQITELKKTDAPWLKESPSQAFSLH